MEVTTWDLVKQGRFAEACDTADRNYRKTGRPHHLGNKILALLNMGKFDQALEVCGKLPNGELIIEGVIFWLMGKPKDAVTTWREERNAKFTDAAGGITSPMLLLYVAANLNDESLRLEAISVIEDVLQRRPAANWPGSLGSYVIGLLNEEQVLASLSQQPILRDRQLCAANFHFGVRSLTSDPGNFIKQMSLAVQGESAIMLEPQFYLAKGELVRKGLAKWAI